MYVVKQNGPASLTPPLVFITIQRVRDKLKLRRRDCGAGQWIGGVLDGKTEDSGTRGVAAERFRRCWASASLQPRCPSRGITGKNALLTTEAQ